MHLYNRFVIDSWKTSFIIIFTQPCFFKKAFAYNLPDSLNFL